MTGLEGVRPTAPRLSLRLLAWAAALALAVVAVELASFGLFYAATGRRFSYDRIAAEQAGEARQAAALVADPAGPMVIPDAELVTHPFMGYVYNPENPLVQQWHRNGSIPAVGDLGFFELPNPPAKAGDLSVAVFGGSVAAYFALEGRTALAQHLSLAPPLRGRSLRLHSVALGGFKQPQMAAALLFLLTQGQHFDAIVELDGFNEVALSFLNYKERGLFPAYPRDWDWLVGQAPDVEQQRRVGKITYLQQWRASAARWFSRRPLAWSVTSGLVWKSVNRWLGSRLARAREDLATSRPPGSSYRQRGPARRYASDLELWDDIVRIWGTSSLQMHRLCAGAGIHYYHFLQPNQYVPGSKAMGEAEKAVAYRVDQPYRLPVEHGYPLLQAEGVRLRAEGVDFHDLTGLFRGLDEPIYKDDCCHVNEKGNAMLAEAIAKAIADGWRP